MVSRQVRRENSGVSAPQPEKKEEFFISPEYSLARTILQMHAYYDAVRNDVPELEVGLNGVFKGGSFLNAGQLDALDRFFASKRSLLDFDALQKELGGKTDEIAQMVLSGKFGMTLKPDEAQELIPYVKGAFESLINCNNEWHRKHDAVVPGETRRKEKPGKLQLKDDSFRFKAYDENEEEIAEKDGRLQVKEDAKSVVLLSKGSPFDQSQAYGIRITISDKPGSNDELKDVTFWKRKPTREEAADLKELEQVSRKFMDDMKKKELLESINTLRQIADKLSPSSSEDDIMAVWQPAKDMEKFIPAQEGTEKLSKLDMDIVSAYYSLVDLLNNLIDIANAKRKEKEQQRQEKRRKEKESRQQRKGGSDEQAVDVPSSAIRSLTSIGILQSSGKVLTRDKLLELLCDWTNGGGFTRYRLRVYVDDSDSFEEAKKKSPDLKPNELNWGGNTLAVHYIYDWQNRPNDYSAETFAWNVKNAMLDLMKSLGAITVQDAVHMVAYEYGISEDEVLDRMSRKPGEKGRLDPSEVYSPAYSDPVYYFTGARTLDMELISNTWRYRLGKIDK